MKRQPAEIVQKNKSARKCSAVWIA